MAPKVIDRREVPPPEQWTRAPVAVGRHHRRYVLVLLVLLGLLVIAAAAVLLGGDVVAPPAAPAGPPRAEHDEAAVAVPFTVTMEVPRVATMDNDRLFGREPAVPDGAVSAAVDDVGDLLDQYLNAQFVGPETRFSDGPARALLSDRATRDVTDDDLAGLGVLDISARQVQAEPVTVRARVLTRGPDAAVVTVRYHVRALVVTADGASVPLDQRATLVFEPEDGRWRATAVDAAVDLPLAEVDR